LSFFADSFIFDLFFYSLYLVVSDISKSQYIFFWLVFVY